MNIKQSVIDLLKEVGSSQITNSSYDIAWIARLGRIEDKMSTRALEWLREHQLEDGSWGSGDILYYHDRVICTLSAVTALQRQGAIRDQARIERAVATLQTYFKPIRLAHAGATVAFEMLLPTLMAEANILGLAISKDTGVLGMIDARERKLARAPGHMISRFTTVAHSAEIAGVDGLHLLDRHCLQEANGSVGYSPAATAFFALNIYPEPRALNYLHTFSTNGQKGMVPNVTPIDIFERAWALWNLSLAKLDSAILNLCKPHLDAIELAWESEKGVGFATGYPVQDGDDTSLVYEVLTHFNRSVDLEAVLSYERKNRFQCFALEANPSITTNIHALGAMKQAGFPKEHPSVQKTLLFLKQRRVKGKYWLGKWHASPYYATAHAVIAMAGYDNGSVENAIEWILATQNDNGSWGYYIPTAEETAYCLQALYHWKTQGRQVCSQVLHKGTTWLRDHAAAPYPPLWIGKCLYSPILVVRSTILSALLLMEQT